MGALGMGSLERQHREGGREDRGEKGKGLCCKSYPLLMGMPWVFLNKSHPQHLALGLHK